MHVGHVNVTRFGKIVNNTRQFDKTLPLSTSPGGYNDGLSKHPTFRNIIRTSAHKAQAISSAPSPQAVVQYHPPAGELHFYGGHKVPQALRSLSQPRR
jgi:hypothetical protein